MISFGSLFVVSITRFILSIWHSVALAVLFCLESLLIVLLLGQPDAFFCRPSRVSTSTLLLCSYCLHLFHSLFFPVQTHLLWPTPTTHYHHKNLLQKNTLINDDQFYSSRTIASLVLVSGSHNHNRFVLGTTTMVYFSVILQLSIEIILRSLATCHTI